MEVGLITIGDEILSGATVNTNAAWLGEQLRAEGATVERMLVVPDRVADIAKVVNEYRAAYDAVIVTGGLGPTHDDVTMEAVAAAFETALAEDDAAKEWLEAEDGYSGDDLAPTTTHIPAEAEFLRNPDGVAPGCTIENVYVLPGLPAEMKAMFELLRSEFEGPTTHTATVETAEYESELIDRVERVRETFGVTIGSYPGDAVTLRISGEDERAVEDARAWLAERVDGVE